MSDRDLDSNYVSNWPNEANQCHNCTSFQTQNGQSICASSSDKTFEEILAENGEIESNAHCDYFQSRD